MIAALGAGIGLGLLGLPLWFGWVGLLWPWLFFNQFGRPHPYLWISCFCLGIGQSQLAWLVGSPYLQTSTAPLQALLFFEAHILLSYLPLALLLSIGHKAAAWQRQYEPKGVFAVLFPPLYLGFLVLSDSWPWPHLLLPSISLRPLVTTVYAASYPWIGSKGVEVFLIMALVAAFLSWKQLLLVSKKAWSGCLFLLLAPLLINTTSVTPPTQGSIKVAYLPRSRTLGAQPQRNQVMSKISLRTKKALDLGVDVVIWPAGALSGLVDSRKSAQWLLNVLPPHQSIIFGTSTKQHNHVYWLSHHKTQVIPITGLASQDPCQPPGLLSGTYNTPDNLSTTAGIFDLPNFSLAPGLCLEQYQDLWYQKREPFTQGYVFLASESSYSLLGKQILVNLGKVKAMQSTKPTLKVADGALSGLVFAAAPAQDLGQWHSNLLTGEIQLLGVPQVSPFYRFGLTLLSVLLVCFSAIMLWLLVPRLDRQQRDYTKG